MRLSVIHPGELGDSELARWSHLQQLDRETESPFLSATFARGVGEVSAAARVACFEDGGLVGFLPISVPLAGRARPIAPGMTNREGFVVSHDFDWEAACALLRKHFWWWRFDKLYATQAVRLEVATATLTTAAMDFSSGWPAYLSWLHSAHARTYKGARSAHRKLVREHQHVECVYEDTDPAAVRWILETKSAQCKCNGWRDRFAEQSTRELVERVIALREDAVRGVISTLRVNGEIIAAAVALRSRSVYSGSIIGHDPRMAQSRPGWVLMLEIGRCSAAAGLSRFELGNGTESFKQKLSNYDVTLAAGTLAGYGPLGRVARAAGAARLTLTHAAARFPQAELAARRAIRRLRYARYRTPPLLSRALIAPLGQREA